MKTKNLIFTVLLFSSHLFSQNVDEWQRFEKTFKPNPTRQMFCPETGKQSPDFISIKNNIKNVLKKFNLNILNSNKRTSDTMICSAGCSAIIYSFTKSITVVKGKSNFLDLLCQQDEDYKSGQYTYFVEIKLKIELPFTQDNSARTTVEILYRIKKYFTRDAYKTITYSNYSNIKESETEIKPIAYSIIAQIYNVVDDYYCKN